MSEAEQNIEAALPWYVDLSETQIEKLLSESNITGKLEQDVFIQLCRFAQSSGSPEINLEIFEAELSKWAGIHNVQALRTMKNVEMVMSQLSRTLSEKKFIRTHKSNGKVVSITLVEPLRETLKDFYAGLAGGDVVVFPDSSVYPREIPAEVLNTVELGEFNSDFISRASEQEKIIKLITGEENQHILIPPAYLPQLPKICMGLLNRWLSDPNHVRQLDDISKEMAYALPSKSINVEILRKILSGTMSEDSRFLSHLAALAAKHILKDKESAIRKSAFTAAKILERYYIYQQNIDSLEAENEQKEEDKKKLMEFIRNNVGPFSFSELQKLRDIEGPEGQLLSRNYNLEDMQNLVDEWLAENTVFASREGEEDNALLTPIVKIQSEKGPVYIHRSNIAAFLTTHVNSASKAVRNQIVRDWCEHLQNYSYPDEMDDPVKYEDKVQSLLKKYDGTLVSFLAYPEVIRNAFLLHANKPDVARQSSRFFPSDTATALRPWSGILNLDRKALYKEAYRQQPFIHRFFLTRLFFAILNMFRTREIVTEIGANTRNETGGAQADGEIQSARREQAIATKSEKKKWLKGIREEAEFAITTVTSEKNIDAYLQKLANEWNIKIGIVRQSFKARIDEEIHKRTKKFIDMLSHLNQPEAQVFIQEFHGIAESIYQLFESEIHDKHAFIDYVVITGLQIIQRWAKKGA